MPLANYPSNQRKLLEKDSDMKKIAITSGDPAGIGPEITGKALRFLPVKENLAYIVYGKIPTFSDGNLITKITDPQEARSAGIYWIEIDNYPIEIGVESENSGRSAYEILERCATDLNANKLDAVVTCPISKSAIQPNHPEFIGHTEFFAQRSGTQEVFMSFWGPHFNLALLTTHMAAEAVPSYLSPQILKKKFRLIYQETKKLLGAPKIAMLAINPHAGENGAFGQEDQIIRTLLDQLAQEDILIDGPFPADTFFSRRATDYDLIISAFHDQGLIPFKMLSAEQGVNVTLGLPYIRTSVDHGTAFDIAGQNIASEASLEAALKFAENMLDPAAGVEFSNYRTFARHYDKYMQQVDYPRWVKLILDRYRAIYSEDPESILEMACGTANIATLLTEKGFAVDASDLAPEMLKIAARKKNPPQLFYADMTDPIKSGSYDLILSLFDSVNYLPDISDLKQLLSHSYQALNQQGMLIFDVVTLKNSQDNFDGFVNLEDSQQQYIIHQSDLDVESRVQTTELTFFSKKGFAYERADEIHQQFIYSVRELKRCIKNSDYRLAGIYCVSSSENLLAKSDKFLEENFSRLFFVLVN
jgi:4-hydroxythreonine-4-phosphate dehydrogenase